MDGNGAWRDNVFVERAYLKACNSASKAHVDIAEYSDWYNLKHAYPGFDDPTLDQEYWQMLPLLQWAA